MLSKTKIKYFNKLLNERLDDLLDVRHDEVGLMLEEEQLPKRVRSIDYRVDKPR